MRPSLFFTATVVSLAVSAAFHYGGWHPIAQFAAASVSLLLLAALLGKATENVAHYAGERIGGLLNATFGNAAELIIALFLVKAGLFDMVKASITGSIIGNLLLVLGLSVLFGGIRNKIQQFNVLLASHSASLMLLSVIALFIPAMFFKQLQPGEVHVFSVIIAVVLIVAYGLWLLFSIGTHRAELGGTAESDEHPEWSRTKSLMLMVAATAGVAVVSEWIVSTIEDVARSFGLSELFVGAFLIAIIGNAAEHSAAVMLAMKNKIGAAFEIAAGSSLQIALFVAPTLILASYAFGRPMDIIFSPIELAAIAVASFIAKSIARDGQTNWYEGVLLLIVYLMLGTAFFFV